MKRFDILIIALAAVVLSGCSPKISGKMSRMYPALSDTAKVVVLDKNEKVPEKVVSIGRMEVGPGRFMPDEKGTFENIVESAKEAARTSGGNIIQITDYLPAGVDCNSARIWGNVYYKYNLDGLNSITSAPEATPLRLIRKQYPYFKTVDEMLPAIRISVFGGYGARTNVLTMFNTATSSSEYYHSLNMSRGFSAGVSGTYFLDDRNGVGLKAGWMYSASADEITYEGEDGVRRTEMADEKSLVTFIGPIYSMRLASRDGRHALIAHAGPGVVRMRDVYNQNLMTAKNLGFTLGLDYDFSITPKIAIGAGVSYINGFITEYYDHTNEIIYEYEDYGRFVLSNVSLNLGLRVNLF